MKNEIGVIVMRAFCCALLFISSVSFGQEPIIRNIPQGQGDSAAPTRPTISYQRKDPSLKVSWPKADRRGINDLVSVDLAIKAATAKAKKRWEKFAIGEPIESCDDSGKLQAYLIPVALGATRFPDLLTPPPATQVDTRSLEDPQLWGVNDFWTIVVSARESDYPVPLHYEGLPACLVTYHKALEKAIKAIGGNGVEMKRYYFLGHRGEFFEFEGSSGKKALVHAALLQIVDPKSVLIDVATATPEPTYTPTDRERQDLEKMRTTYQTQVREAWDEIKGHR